MTNRPERPRTSATFSRGSHTKKRRQRHAPAQPVAVREGVDLDVVVVAVAVARVPPQVGRQLPRGVPVIQVRLRRPPVHHRMQACGLSSQLTSNPAEGAVAKSNTGCKPAASLQRKLNLVGSETESQFG